MRAHHRSPDREEREANEAARGERRIVVFAASTLEIGIDSGDIVLVLLDGPAPGLPALPQWIGQGNRPTGAPEDLNAPS